jgi:hypothetical protein
VPLELTLAVAPPMPPVLELELVVEVPLSLELLDALAPPVSLGLPLKSNVPRIVVQAERPAPAVTSRSPALAALPMEPRLRVSMQDDRTPRIA